LGLHGPIHQGGGSGGNVGLGVEGFGVFEGEIVDGLADAGFDVSVVGGGGPGGVLDGELGGDLDEEAAREFV
jgi:hypothetical protein